MLFVSCEVKVSLCKRDSNSIKRYEKKKKKKQLVLQFVFDSEMNILLTCHENTKQQSF